MASVMGGFYPSGGINLGPAMTFGTSRGGMRRTTVTPSLHPPDRPGVPLHAIAHDEVRATASRTTGPGARSWPPRSTASRGLQRCERSIRWTSSGTGSRGLAAVLAVLLGSVATTALAGRDGERSPLVVREAGNFLRRWPVQQPQPDDRPDVRRVPDSPEAEVPLSDHPGARRRPDRRRMERDARRPRGLDPVLPAARLRRVRGRPAGAWAIRLQLGLRTAVRCIRCRGRAAAVGRARALHAVARGEPAHAVGSGPRCQATPPSTSS
jgi:hypothetical protein